MRKAKRTFASWIVGALAAISLTACSSSCGLSCENDCWPVGRIGPTCPELCADPVEDKCCPGDEARPYVSPGLP